MAIAFARARYLSRASGGNAVRSAAYNARETIEAERTGEVFSFKHREAPAHHEVLLPEGADPRLTNSAVLWNAAEAAERRKDAQVAREMVLALPADRVLSDEDRVELARSFAIDHFVSKGLAVQLDVHAPHKDRGEGEGVFAEGTGGDHLNWHAHLLITTRRVEGDHLAAKKARELDPEVRRAGSRALVSDGEAWGETWRAHQDRYFLEHGIALRVDATAAHPGEHIGPVRMRKVDSPAVARAAALRTVNEAAARDPEQVLAALTRTNATFSERDLHRYLAKHLGAGADGTDDAVTARTIAAAKEAVLGHQSVRALYDRKSGEAAERFTTRAVREQERAALADGSKVASARHHQGLQERHQAAALAGYTLRVEQRAAFERAVAAGGLKLIEGRAGTGKSYTLAAVRVAYAEAGYRVVGLGPTNTVAQDLMAGGFTEASTVHAALFQLKNGRLTWDRRTVLVVDEAAMLDSRVTGELLAEARRAGAKLILAGDDRQLASIERGGLFTALREKHGAAVITEVTRQRVDWQREASRDLAEGRFDSAVLAYDRHGAITWTADQDAARAALVARWKADTAADPRASRFVFAYTNTEVSLLNEELRQVRQARGELAGPDIQFETKHGPAAFAVGDRVQFTDTDKRRHLYNGNAGVITAIDAQTGEITARLDAAAGAVARDVSWSAGEFDGFRHGYAGTIYKGQGKTLDHTYLLHSHHWRAAASYVALTRQRESAQVFVARETANDAHRLARQMARGEVRAASVAWATADELAPDLRQRVQEAERSVAEAPSPDARSRQPPRTEPGWLIPPYAGAGARDSLGRDVSPERVAAVVAADPAVRREREALASCLRGAYRDPVAAQATLNALVVSEGWTSAAARLAADPAQLGVLRGRDSLFAGARARAEREAALHAASAIAPSLTRLGTAETQAERQYRDDVQRQITSDAVGIPRLSAAAEAAISALAAAPADAARAEVWRAVQADTLVAGELRAFGDAVERRFGADAVRAMLRAAGQPGSVAAASVAADQQAALDQISALTATVSAGERATATTTRREVEAERLAQRKVLRP